MQAIEEGTLDMIDNSDFVNTDIPFEVPLPEQPFMTVRVYTICTILLIIFPCKYSVAPHYYIL